MTRSQQNFQTAGCSISRRRPRLRANIFQGLPAFSPEEEQQPHFFPWDEARTIPLIENFEVEVERIVTFRPFAHHLKQPDCATYVLWGEGDEAHMTNLQTARQASGPFEVPAFSPDYDHVMTLKSAPNWLDAPLLEAGVPVSVPSIRLNDPETGRPTIPVGVPIEEGTKLTVLYRGVGDPRIVVAGRSPLAGTAVCNSEGMDASSEKDALVMSGTPEELMR
ncbi:hypothetical protein JSE7799_00598 [Jannaschia seosinensis]|uniref:Uncharacterized protein n=1 Tax=Jannaschia seosinensis TaxID=313367 RepID=A0A0M7B500_9RHOB|nr:hypothetical protein [Jannaschia seosinensis]CUH22575.1 hypothetical protein JSE7799_00598 [Jannaschia seosinensis]